MTELLTKSFYLADRTTEIKVGEDYYFGEICDGDCDVEEVLESGAVAYDNAEPVIDFKIIGEAKGLETIVKVTDIF